ncbi:uncharacterized protein [Euphorbia lathyris]|uniref:uncharacterized protein isoform X2 n=1 Tax=Euphorbia lathyris TaxID=212925 RepID=UPI003313492C
MENVDANQLPEVDALPDGFVDSSIESLAPPTPTYEQEKPLKCNKNSISEIENSIERVPDLAVNEPQNSQESSEKANPGLFPIPLPDIDGFDVSEQLEVMPSKACVQLAEGETALPNSVNLASENSIGLSGHSEVNEQVQENNQSSERQSSDTQVSDAKETSSPESIELQKGRKPETAEVKRKNVKRSFKSEKEFLEFTLKYQQVLTERDTAIAIRDKLESLCRELQRQNKMLMEECKRVSTEGQNLRLDLSTKFQDAIKDVSNKLDEQKEECFSQLKENEMLRNKLKQLADQYMLSEQQYEQKLADLKMKQHEEKLLQEQSQMKVYAEQVSQLLATEKNLRVQLTADGEKFQQFQDALLKSNEVFQTFKQEIEKMGKSIKELKKENVFLKSKSEKSDITLIELVEEREKLKKQLEKTKNQKEKLESLCRSLQAERKQHTTGYDAVPSDQI